MIKPKGMNMTRSIDNSNRFIRIMLRRCPTAATVLRIAVVFIVSASYMPIMAHSTPSQLYEKWKQDAEAVGATIGNGQIQYDAITDRLTIPDFQISYWNLYDISESVAKYDLYSSENSGALEEDIQIGLKINAGNIFLSGIRQADKHTRIQNVGFPDGLHFDLIINFGDFQLPISVRFTGLILKDAIHSNQTPEPATGFDPGTRWVQVFNHFGFNQVGSGKADSLEYSYGFNVNEHKLFEYQVEERIIEFKEYRDGILGSYTAENQKTKVEEFIDMDEELAPEITTAEKIDLTGLNLNSFIQLLDIPQNRGSGNSIIIENYSVKNTASNSGGTVNTIENSEFQSFSISLQNLDVLGIIALLLSDVSIESPVFYTDLIRTWLSIDFDDLNSSGIEAIGAINSDGDTFAISDELNSLFRLAIDEIIWGNEQNSNQKEFSIKGFNFGFLPSGENLKIGGLKLNNITAAETEEIEKSLNEIETQGSIPEDPIILAKLLLPRSLSVEIGDVELSSSDSASKETILRIDRINSSFSSEVPPVPTELILEGSNIEIPMDGLDFPFNLGFLESLNSSILNLSFGAKLQWKENNEELLLEGLKIELTDLGILEANLRFSGVEKAMLENPLDIPNQLDSVIFESVDFTYTDKGSLQRYIEFAAGELNQSVSETSTLVKILILQLADLLSVEFALQVQPELEKFLSNPGNFILSASPKAPMSILNFVELATVPSAFPHVFNIEVKANQ